MSTATTRLTPDERYEAAALTAAHQRRNQPRALVMLGGVVFLIACAAFAGAWVSKASAMRELSYERTQTDKVRHLAADLDAYRTARELDPSIDQLFEPDPAFLSKVAQLARQAGLANDPPVPARAARSVEGGRRIDWPYKLTEPDLGAVLAWIRLVNNEIPGTFVYRFLLRPRGNQWNVEVTLSWYEQ